MPDSPKPPSPLDGARQAFDPLSTPEKTAFVVEAMFETVGQALSETGRAVADALNRLDVDTWFRAPNASTSASPEPPPPAPSTPPPAPPRPPAA